MKKLGSILAFIPASVFAVDIEVGAGVAHYTTRGNMMWYQEGFPHKLDLNAPTLELGLSDNFIQYGRWGVKWRASYVYLGNVHSDAWATPVDSNYNPQTKSCNGECYHMSRYVGNGHNQGIRLTLEPNYTFNGWKFGVEGGAYIYRPTWNATIYDVPPCKGCEGQTLHSRSPHNIQFAPVIGASISHGPFSVSYMHYFNKTRNDPGYAIWKHTDTVTLRYRF